MSGVWGQVLGSVSEGEEGPFWGRGKVPTQDGLDIS